MSARPERSCLLIHPNDPQGHTHIMAMGLPALADHLCRAGFPAEVAHTGVEERRGGPEGLVELLDRDRLLVGISCHWASQLVRSLELAARVKALRPEVFVVLGGFTASFFAEELVRDHGCVDGVIRGDGEVPLLELVRRLDAARGTGSAADLAGVPNLVWRRDEAPVINRFSYVAEAADLDALEFAAFAPLRHLEDYQEISAFSPGAAASSGASPTFYLCVGRGCPARCNYCGGGCAAQRRVNGRSKLVFRSVERTVETLERAVASGFRTVYVSFDPDPARRWYRRLFRAVRERGLELDLVFGCWSLPDRTFLDDLQRTFPGALLELSPETASERVRRANGSPWFFTNAQLEETLVALGERGLGAHVYFSYFHATDDAASLERTRRYRWELLERHGSFLDAYYLALSTDPASPLFLDPEGHGVEMEVSSLADYLEVVRRGRLGNFLCHRPAALAPADAARAEERISADAFLGRTFHGTFQALLRLAGAETVVDLLDDFYAAHFGGGAGYGSLAELADLAHAFELRAVELLGAGELENTFLGDLVRFEGLLAAERMEGRTVPPPAVSTIAEIAPDGSRPRCCAGVRLERFHYDVPAIAEHLRSRPGVPVAARRPTTVITARRGDTLTTLRVNPTMEALVRTCDGVATVRGVAEALRTTYGLPAEQAPRVLDDTLTGVRELARAGVLELT